MLTWSTSMEKSPVMFRADGHGLPFDRVGKTSRLRDRFGNYVTTRKSYQSTQSRMGTSACIGQTFTRRYKNLLISINLMP